MHIPEGTLISVDELNQYPPEQVVLVTTGSQGEPLSALSLSLIHIFLPRPHQCKAQRAE